MTITELEQAVTQLSERDFSRFYEWIEEYYAQKWDAQIECDAKAGKLDKIVEQAMEEYTAGLSKPL